jgi:hypothetical protein
VKYQRFGSCDPEGTLMTNDSTCAVPSSEMRVLSAETLMVPARKEQPRTKRVLDRMEPIIYPWLTCVVRRYGWVHTEVWTIRTSPSRRATMPTMISTAFPKVAIKRPASVCPRDRDTSSVASPSNCKETEHNESKIRGR